MKVILLKNIPKIGQKGDVKELKEGYVRNMLLPKGLAKIATTTELNVLKKQAEKNKEYQNAELSKALEIFKKLEGRTIILKEKTNEKGHLFARVGKQEIISAVKNSTGIFLPEDWFELSAIKEVGEYEIKLVFENLRKKFVLKVE